PDLAPAKSRAVPEGPVVCAEEIVGVAVGRPPRNLAGEQREATDRRAHPGAARLINLCGFRRRKRSREDRHLVDQTPEELSLFLPTANPEVIHGTEGVANRPRAVVSVDQLSVGVGVDGPIVVNHANVSPLIKRRDKSRVYVAPTRIRIGKSPSDGA